MAEIVKTVEQATETCGKKTYPITITRLRSAEPFWHEFQGEMTLVDAVTIVDAGKYGTSTVVTAHRDYTEAERQAGRRHIQEVLARCMTEQGLW